MKRKIVLILAIFLVLNSCQKEIIVDHTILSNCHVIDVKTGEISEGSDIWIDEDRILKITPHNKNLSTTDTLIDASGKYVIPGLWDMHAHIVDYDWVPKMYMALGVTGIRIMHGGSLIDTVNAYRKDGFHKGFEFLYSSPIIDGPGDVWPGTTIASTPDEGRELVRKFKQQGYDFVKVYNLLSRETYFAIADECNKLNYPFAGHVPFMITTEEAIQAGQKSIEHSLGIEHAITDLMEFKTTHKESNLHELTLSFLEAYDSTRVESVLAKTKNMWFCPTLIGHKSYTYGVLYDSIYKSDPRLKYIPDEEKQWWFGEIEDEALPSYFVSDKAAMETDKEYIELQMSYLKPMLDNGSKFLAGTDTSNEYVYPGFAVHEEMQIFVEAGFTELEALQTATLNPAVYAGFEDRLGTLEAGKIANILILDKNPLENIKNTLTIYGLIRRGEYFSKDYLDNLLNDLIN